MQQRLKKTKKCRDDACKSKGTRWDDSCKSEGTRSWNNTCKCKSPKYPYISGLLQRRTTDKYRILFLYLLQPSNYLSRLHPPKPDTSCYLQLSTTSSDCILQTQIPLVIYNCHATTSSDCVLLNTDTSV